MIPKQLKRASPCLDTGNTEMQLKSHQKNLADSKCSEQVSFCPSQQEGNAVSLITDISVSFRSGGDVKGRDTGNSTKITLKNGRWSCALGNHDGSQKLYSPGI